MTSTAANVRAAAETISVASARYQLAIRAVMNRVGTGGNERNGDRFARAVEGIFREDPRAEWQRTTLYRSCAQWMEKVATTRARVVEGARHVGHITRARGGGDQDGRNELD